MIRTVRGDIPREIVVNVLPHEHIRCVSNDLLAIFGKAWLDETELSDCAAGILNCIKEKFALSLFVDGTPPDLGRNARLLREISQKTGVHIVASTGLYHYP